MATARATADHRAGCTGRAIHLEALTTTKEALMPAPEPGYSWTGMQRSLPMCNFCGAAVHDKQKHTLWHQQLFDLLASKMPG